MQSDRTGSNSFQTFSTLLALLLPVVQFFFNFLPKQSKTIFLIENQFFVVSVIAGIFAYLLIIAFKNTVWFQVAFNRRKHHRYQEFTRLTDPNTYAEDEIKKTIKNKRVEPPFYLNSANVYYVLIPVVFVLMICFFGLGLFFQGTTNNFLIFTQALTYILLVGLTSLTLAAFYINDTNRRRNETVNKEKYRRVVQLLFDSHALGEFPAIEFVGQGTLQVGSLTTIVKVNGQKTYRVNTDFEAGVLQTVELIPEPVSSPPDIENITPLDETRPQEASENENQG